MLMSDKSFVARLALTHEGGDKQCGSNLESYNLFLIRRCLSRVRIQPVEVRFVAGIPVDFLEFVFACSSRALNCGRGCGDSWLHLRAEMLHKY